MTRKHPFKFTKPLIGFGIVLLIIVSIFAVRGGMLGNISKYLKGDLIHSALVVTEPETIWLDGFVFNPDDVNLYVDIPVKINTNQKIFSFTFPISYNSDVVEFVGVVNNPNIVSAKNWLQPITLYEGGDRAIILVNSGTEGQNLEYVNDFEIMQLRFRTLTANDDGSGAGNTVWNTFYDGTYFDIYGENYGFITPNGDASIEIDQTIYDNATQTIYPVDRFNSDFNYSIRTMDIDGSGLITVNEIGNQINIIDPIVQVEGPHLIEEEAVEIDFLNIDLTMHFDDILNHVDYYNYPEFKSKFSLSNDDGVTWQSLDNIINDPINLGYGSANNVRLSINDVLIQFKGLSGDYNRIKIEAGAFKYEDDGVANIEIITDIIELHKPELDESDPMNPPVSVDRLGKNISLQFDVPLRDASGINDYLEDFLYLSTDGGESFTKVPDDTTTTVSGNIFTIHLHNQLVGENNVLKILPNALGMDFAFTESEETNEEIDVNLPLTAVMSSVFPHQGKIEGGTDVYITTQNLGPFSCGDSCNSQDLPTVTFNGVEATNVRFLNEDVILATTPPQSGENPVVIEVNFQGMTVTNTDNLGAVIPPLSFEYTIDPIIVGVDPMHGNLDGGRLITLRLENFGEEFNDYYQPKVLFDDTYASSTFGFYPTEDFTPYSNTELTRTDLSDTIQIYTPSHNEVEVVDITVTLGSGAREVTAVLEDIFKYFNEKPMINEVIPNVGTILGGTRVTLMTEEFGDFLTTKPQVQFNGTPIADENVFVINDDVVEIVTSRHTSGPVRIDILSGENMASKIAGYVYKNCPMIYPKNPYHDDHIIYVAGAKGGYDLDLYTEHFEPFNVSMPDVWVRDVRVEEENIIIDTDEDGEYSILAIVVPEVEEGEFEVGISTIRIKQGSLEAEIPFKFSYMVPGDYSGNGMLGPEDARWYEWSANRYPEYVPYYIRSGVWSR